MKILCLGAHIDDVEIGCGGSIVRFIKEGNEVYYAAFSIAEDSLPEGLPKDILTKEVKVAAKIIGIKPENLFIFRYPVRKFPQYRQEILEDLVKLEKEIKPDLTFLPVVDDLHQDHPVIAIEGCRAFRFASILSYEIPANNISFTASAFITLEEWHVEKKTKAIKCYKSQELRRKSLGREPANLARIKALAQVRGSQIRVDYAEAFDIVRWIIK